MPSAIPDVSDRHVAGKHHDNCFDNADGISVWSKKKHCDKLLGAFVILGHKKVSKSASELLQKLIGHLFASQRSIVILPSRSSDCSRRLRVLVIHFSTACRRVPSLKAVGGHTEADLVPREQARF